MDPQFKEAADEITRNVTAAVTESVTKAVTDSVTKAVTESVTKAVTAAVNEHVSAVVSKAEERLSKQAEIHLEAVKGEVRLAAEGYAASLDAIHRRFDALEKKVDTRLYDHDLVLKNHSERINALERR